MIITQLHTRVNANSVGKASGAGVYLPSVIWWLLALVILIAAAKLGVRRIQTVHDAAPESEADATPGSTADADPRTTQQAGPALVVHTKPLRGMPEIRQFFRTNEVPVYFVS